MPQAVSFSAPSNFNFAMMKTKCTKNEEEEEDENEEREADEEDEDMGEKKRLKKQDTVIDNVFMPEARKSGEAIFKPDISLVEVVPAIAEVKLVKIEQPAAQIAASITVAKSEDKKSDKKPVAEIVKEQPKTEAVKSSVSVKEESAPISISSTSLQQPAKSKKRLHHMLPESQKTTSASAQLKRAKK